MYHDALTGTSELPFNSDVENKRICRLESLPEGQRVAAPDLESWLRDISDESFYHLGETDLRVGDFALNSVSGGNDNVAEWNSSVWCPPLTDLKTHLVPQLGCPTPDNFNGSLVATAGLPWAQLSPRYETTASRHAANLIARMVSALPQMMVRRHTFPPFIHAHWHLDAEPETLASCMRISEMFVSRTPESRAFLWRTIEAEVKHLYDEVCSLGVFQSHVSFGQLSPSRSFYN